MDDIISRENFTKIFNKNNYKLGIELGSYRGEFAKHILDNWDGSLICIDLFDRSDNYDFNNETGYYSGINKNLILPEFNDKLKSHYNNLLTIQSDTVGAVKFFPDNHFDFIYIDADHRYESVIKDMEMWYPKLKSGGLFSGHDFIDNFDYSTKNNKVYQPHNLSEYVGEFGVNYAVKEFAEKNNVHFFTTGEYYWKSWYWIKS